MLDDFYDLVDAENADAALSGDELHSPLWRAGTGREHSVEPDNSMRLLPVDPAARQTAECHDFASL